MRLNEQPSERASDLASTVLPSPGTSSSRICPSASSATSTSSTTASLPTITRPMFSCSRRASAATASTPASSITVRLMAAVRPSCMSAPSPGRNGPGRASRILQRFYAESQSNPLSDSSFWSDGPVSCVQRRRGAHHRGAREVQQPARFLFQLRRNIALEGDLQLAQLELGAFLPGELAGLDHLTAAVVDLPALGSLCGFGALGSHSRPRGRQGYTANGLLGLLPELVRRLSFVQRLWCVTEDTEAARRFLAGLSDQLGPVLAWQADAGGLVVQAVPHYAIIELSEVVARRAGGVAEMKRNLDVLLAALLERTTERHAVQLAEKALRAGSTTSHLSHDIHYYKAKFFPRLVRSLLNVCAQRLGPGQHRVLDNFAGSGTALLEASLLGIPSAGLDLDPLSVMIARAKLDVLRLNASHLANEAAKVLDAVGSGAAGRLDAFGEQRSAPPDEDIT